jgi:hypothetical protein
MNATRCTLALAAVLLCGCANPTAPLDYGTCANYAALGPANIGLSVGEQTAPQWERQTAAQTVRWQYADAGSVVFDGTGALCVLTITHTQRPF